MKGIPIRDLVLPTRVNVGITIEADTGYVSEYECRESCKHSGYTWAEWDTLTVYERAGSIAHWRMSLLIEGHVNEALHKYQEAQSKKR